MFTKKTQTNNEYWQEQVEKQELIYLWWECKMVQPLCFFSFLKICLFGLHVQLVGS